MALKYDCFRHDQEQLECAPLVVTLMYQSFCDPARSTKRYVEELARTYDFPLIRINGDHDWGVDAAGEIIPQVCVYHKGVPTLPISGAVTKKRLTEYLKVHGAIPP